MSEARNVCGICKKTYTRKSNLRRHFERHHGQSTGVVLDDDRISSLITFASERGSSEVDYELPLPTGCLRTHEGNIASNVKNAKLQITSAVGKNLPSGPLASDTGKTTELQQTIISSDSDSSSDLEIRPTKRQKIDDFNSSSDESILQCAQAAPKQPVLESAPESELYSPNLFSQSIPPQTITTRVEIHSAPKPGSSSTVTRPEQMTCIKVIMILNYSTID